MLNANSNSTRRPLMSLSQIPLPFESVTSLGGNFLDMSRSNGIGWSVLS